VVSLDYFVRITGFGGDYKWSCDSSSTGLKRTETRVDLELNEKKIYL